MRRSLFYSNRHAIYSAGGASLRERGCQRASLEARAALGGGMGAPAAIRPGGPSAHRCRLPAPSIFRRSVRPLTTGLERAAQRGSVGTSGTTRALRAKQARLGGPWASEPTAHRAGSIGRDRRCLSGPLRAAARGGGGEAAPAPAAAGGAVGRERAGGGRGRGRAACEPGSGRRGRAGPMCAPSLAVGRTQGRRLSVWVGHTAAGRRGAPLPPSEREWRLGRRTAAHSQPGGTQGAAGSSPRAGAGPVRPRQFISAWCAPAAPRGCE